MYVCLVAHTVDFDHLMMLGSFSIKLFFTFIINQYLVMSYFVTL